jgi:hypothetical protein
VNTWPNLCGIFCGHDTVKDQPLGWQRAAIKSDGARRHTVQQLFVNAQQLDQVCSASASRATGAGELANVFLLSRRPALGLLEGRMISTHTGNWFKSEALSSPGRNTWSEHQKLLFSVPFTGLA